MAFSAQTDHGQCERKDAVLCGIGQETSKRKAKVRFGPVTFHSALICVLHTVFVCKTCDEEIVRVRCFSRGIGLYFCGLAFSYTYFS